MGLYRGLYGQCYRGYYYGGYAECRPAHVKNGGLGFRVRGSRSTSTVPGLYPRGPTPPNMIHIKPSFEPM